MRTILDSPKEIKDEPTEPWSPAAILTHKPRPGFRSKWIRKDLLDKKTLEGWVPREADMNEVSPGKTIIDGSQQGKYVTKRNLVLCDMPETKAKSRDAYFKRLTDAATQSATESFKEKFGNRETYGEGLKEDQVD